MPILNGLEAAAQIRARLPAMEILLFSGSSSRRGLLELFHSKAGGCLLKSEPAEELMPALESLRRHHHFRSRAITALCAEIAKDSVETARLTKREVEILRLLAADLSTKQIAAELGVSPKTIETHRTHMLRKLGASTPSSVSSATRSDRGWWSYEGRTAISPNQEAPNFGLTNKGENKGEGERYGKGYRQGAVKRGTQSKNPVTKDWTRHDEAFGSKKKSEFTDIKSDVKKIQRNGEGRIG